MDTMEELIFFDKKPEALSLYECFKEKVQNEIDDVNIRVQKTQITFSNRHVFACVSFLPVRKAALRPPAYIVISFGLSHRIELPRIEGAVEPYPNRWTHHVLIAMAEEIDGELLKWIKEASDFSAGKR